MNVAAGLKYCGAKVVGMSLVNDDDAKRLAKSMGAVELLDKVSLGKELIPALLKFARPKEIVMQRLARRHDGALPEAGSQQGKIA